MKKNFRPFPQSGTSSKSDSEDSDSEEECSSGATNQTSKQSSDDDDDDVEIRSTKNIQSKRNSIQEKRNAPVPQVRFLKPNNGRK